MTYIIKFKKKRKKKVTTYSVIIITNNYNKYHFIKYLSLGRHNTYYIINQLHDYFKINHVLLLNDLSSTIAIHHITIINIKINNCVFQE